MVATFSVSKAGNSDIYKILIVLTKGSLCFYIHNKHADFVYPDLEHLDN